MKVNQPPYPEYREQSVTPSRDYRVVFWERQLAESSGLAQDEMGWSELTVDLADVQDVQDAIEWAERNIDGQLDGGRTGGPHGERLYVLCVKVPNEDQFVQITGWDPVVSPDAPEANLPRKRP